MAKIYFSLILKGLKTFNDVPEQIRGDVRALLDAEEKAIGQRRHDKLESEFIVPQQLGI